MAGLVGEGLSRLFACTGYEKQEVADVSKTLANTMGLLLQKTNIIRDYLEDYVDGRAFWPQEVHTLPLLLLSSVVVVEVYYSILCVCVCVWVTAICECFHYHVECQVQDPSDLTCCIWFRERRRGPAAYVRSYSRLHREIPVVYCAYFSP